MKRRLTSILKSVAWLTGSAYVGAGLAILRGVLFARILGPSAYGLWGFLSTVQALAMSADLGVRSVVSRDMPGLLARGKEQEAATLAALTRVWMPAAYCVGGIALAVLWPVFHWPSAPGWSVLVPLLLLGWGLFTAAQTLAIGSLAFRQLAMLTTLGGLAGLVGGVIGSTTYGVNGLVASQALVYGAAGVIVLSWYRASSTGARVFEAWRRAIAEGWRLLVNSLSLQSFVQLDMLVAAWALPTSAVGLYSVALTGSTMVGSLVSGGVGTVVGQHLHRETALSESGVPPAALVWGPAGALAAVLAPVCAVAALLTPWVLQTMLPKYTSAAGPAVLLLAAAYYLDSQFGFSTTFVAVRRPLATVPLYAVLIVVDVAIDLLLLGLGWGLLGIATGTLVANACFHVGHQALVAAKVSGGRRQALQAMSSFAAGGLPVAAALAVLGHSSTAIVVAALGAAGWGILVYVTAVELEWHNPSVR